jgi:hypothetical protein
MTFLWRQALVLFTKNEDCLRLVLPVGIETPL